MVIAKVIAWLKPPYWLKPGWSIGSARLFLMGYIGGYICYLNHVVGVGS